MASRFRHFFYQGAASALFACATPSFPDAVDDPADLPLWMQRAQQRLSLTASQRREVRELVELNTSKLAALQRRPELQPRDDPAFARHDELAALQREFRAALSAVLSPAQLAEWDSLLTELLGEAGLRQVALPAGRQH